MSKLYNDARNPSKKTLGTGYGSEKKARETLKIIKTLPEVKQKQIIITMFNRAKYHKYRTKNMEEAMNIFSIWMKKHGIKHSKRKMSIKQNRKNTKKNVNSRITKVQYCSGKGSTEPPCKKGGKKTKKIILV